MMKAFCPIFQHVSVHVSRRAPGDLEPAGSFSPVSALSWKVLTLYGGVPSSMIKRGIFDHKKVPRQ